ncbi:hypothetical protein [Bermanella sp. R86510]|uniref:hypothetical protein n=1 Tax=unclassified Bermanella TaxID=2627862 RepID=UPI0037C90499
MPIRFLIACLLTQSVWAQDLVFPNSTGVAEDKAYFTYDTPRSRFIYTQDNQEFAQHAAKLSTELHPLYEQSFGYRLDTRLAVGIMSDHNQVANGFSTQFPLNRQINYLGGAQNPDYFASSSWLNTLIYHETAHNYQVNAKDNPLSKAAYSLVRNGNFLFILPVIHPNSLESSFILEGNGVLNESWHGDGGRLYSGLYRAMLHAHAKAGTLTKARLYNETLNFPYREGHYIFGADYQYFLAEKFGLDQTNLYFKKRSRNWYFPFTVNSPTRITFGRNFDELFLEWKTHAQERAQAFELVKGELLTQSQFYSPLNKQGDEIVFLNNTSGVSVPTLNRYSVTEQQFSQQKKSLKQGKIFSIGDNYYSASSAHTSPWRITQGLFDAQGYIKPNSHGKVIQGYMNDGREVYFKSSESALAPQLYVNNDYYGTVNSSVLVSGNSLYYFVQSGKRRTLYQDKQALFDFEGHYGFVTDVDTQGNIYFIANTKLGSSLFKWTSSGVSQVIAADNVIDAKLINDNKVIASAINEKHYYYVISDLTKTSTQPYKLQFFWDKKQVTQERTILERSRNTTKTQKKLTFSNPAPYTFANNFDYSSGTLFRYENSNGDTRFDANILFSDPLTYNQFAIQANKDADQTTRLALRYSNNQHALLYGAQTYYVVENGFADIAPNLDTRDYGIALDTKFPFLRSGFWYGSAELGYFQDYISFEREPLTLNMQINYQQQYGYSYFANKQASLTLANTKDRNTHVHSLEFKLWRELGGQFYTGIAGKHSQSSGRIDLITKGVQLETSEGFIGTDKTGFTIPSLNNDTIAESVSKAELSLAKVFNASAYYFKFPISLRRQALRLNYRYFDIKDTYISRVYSPRVRFAQLEASLDFDTTILNKIPLTVRLSVTQNEDNPLTQNTNSQLQILLPL